MPIGELCVFFFRIIAMGKNNNMWKLTVESDLNNLSLHEKYFKYSTAYLDAAVTFCEKLIETPERDKHILMVQLFFT